MRNGAQYIDAMRRLKADVWLHGRKVTDPLEEPILRAPMQEIGRLYDMQHAPDTRDLITHVCTETGERVSNAFLLPRSYEDLLAHRRVFEHWAEATYGLMGRSPDFLNVTLTSMVANLDYFRAHRSDFADNLERFYRHVRDNDLFLTHAIISPQGDRSKPSHQQENKYLNVGVVEETSDGLIVRGSKLLATLAPITDELFIYPYPGFQRGDERYALAFSIPLNTPGLRILCREGMQDGTRPVADHPLASRFEEMDAVVVFHDVLIPWERVFIYGDVDVANGLYPKTGLWQQPTHQTAVRGLVKMSMAAGVAIKVAESIGADYFLHVQDALGELVQHVETIKALLDYAERHFTIMPSGEARPEPESMLTIRGIMSRAYPRAVELIQTLGAGGLLQMPTAADLTHPELAQDMNDYMQGKPGVSATERIRLFKLAWDLCGEAFGQRLVQYERYYAGDPIRLRATHYLKYPKASLTRRVDRALAEAHG